MNTKKHVLLSTSKRASGTESCITYPVDRHLEAQAPHASHSDHSPMGAVASVDWYEIGGVVTWSQDRLLPLEDAFQKALKTRKAVTLNLGQRIVWVHPDGYGEGPESHMRYRISWCKVEIDIDPRLSTDRQLYNFRLRASGKACVVLGLAAILEFQDSILQALGGRMDDSWIKRIDICLDIWGLPVLDKLQQKLQDGCFVTSSRKTNGQIKHIESFDSGFTIRSRDILLNVYDKLREMRERRHGDDYRQAMIQNRWGGEQPTTATRVEFQILKGRLFGIGMRTAKEVLSRLGEVVFHATADTPQSFFRMTETVPDAKNGHQARAKTLPLWKWIIERLREGSVKLHDQLNGQQGDAL